MLRVFIFLMSLMYAMSYNPDHYIFKNNRVYRTYNYTILVHHNITKLTEMVIENLNDGWQLAGGATVTAPMYSAFSQTMIRVNH